MSPLHFHLKKHGAMDHLTFNFLNSTNQDYLCEKHIHEMSKEKQTAFWKENISNPRYAMMFQFHCGLSHLQIKEVQNVVKGQKLPNQCDDYDPCCFCFTPSMKVATPISLQPLPTSWIELLTLN